MPKIQDQTQAIFFQTRITNATWLDIRRDNATWITSNGVATNFTLWHDGQPSNETEYTCAVMTNRGKVTGWQTERCDSCKDVFCERGRWLTYCLKLKILSC